jgi:hypothetical protein
MEKSAARRPHWDDKNDFAINRGARVRYLKHSHRS